MNTVRQRSVSKLVAGSCSEMWLACFQEPFVTQLRYAAVYLAR
jgi:hypothetical protein